MMIAERAYQSWQDLANAGVKRPQSEADYEELLALMDDLTSHHDINEQPWSDLFGLVAGYMHEWELEFEPELKLLGDIPPHDMLARIMKARGVTQSALAVEGIVDQGTLSKILSGQRGISKALAKRLAKHFGVDVETFL